MLNKERQHTKQAYFSHYFTILHTYSALSPHTQVAIFYVCTVTSDVRF